VADNQDF